jgi:hypothetical protein
VFISVHPWFSSRPALAFSRTESGQGCPSYAFQPKLALRAREEHKRKHKLRNLERFRSDTLQFAFCNLQSEIVPPWSLVFVLSSWFLVLGPWFLVLGP